MYFWFKKYVREHWQNMRERQEGDYIQEFRNIPYFPETVSCMLSHGEHVPNLMRPYLTKLRTDRRQTRIKRRRHRRDRNRSRQAKARRQIGRHCRDCIGSIFIHALAISSHLISSHINLNKGEKKKRKLTQQAHS